MSWAMIHSIQSNAIESIHVHILAVDVTVVDLVRFESECDRIATFMFSFVVVSEDKRHFGVPSSKHPHEAPSMTSSGVVVAAVMMKVRWEEM